MSNECEDEQSTAVLDDDSPEQVDVDGLALISTTTQQLDRLFLSEKARISKPEQREVRRLFQDLASMIMRQQRRMDQLTGRNIVLEEAIRTELKPTPTYAEVASTQQPKIQHPKKKVETAHVITVYPKEEDGETDSETTRNLLLTTIKPRMLKIGITRISKVRNGGVAIESAKKEDIEKLKAEVESNNILKTKLNVKVPTRRLPRILIRDIAEEINKENLQEALVEQNEVFTTDSKVEPLFNFKGKRNTQSWVVALDPDAFRKVMKSGKVNIGWTSCRISEHLRPLQCYNCLRLGHVAAQCENYRACGKCGEKDHDKITCKATKSSCINCHFANDQFGQKLYTDHSPMDPRCPSLQRAIANLKKKIDYGS